jgi:hypothetical protein
MSTKYKVEFREIADAYELSEPIQREIELLINLLFLNIDWHKDPLDFIFRKAHAHPFPKTKPFNFNAEQIYKPMIGVRRELSDYEKRLCLHLQSIIDECEGDLQIRKAFGTLFEKYIYRRESKSKMGVFCNCHIYVEDKKIDNDGRGSIDIGLDQLDQNEVLQMSECAISIGTFEKKDHQQYKFYSLAFDHVRTVARKARLQLNLIAACSAGRRNWRNVYINDKNFSQSSVTIRTECLLDKVEDGWSN